MTRTSQFDFGLGPDADPAYQCDTKRKLFSAAEVCALTSAVPFWVCVAPVYTLRLILNAFGGNFGMGTEHKAAFPKILQPKKF